MIEVKVSYHPDHGTAMEKTRFWAPLALSPEEKRDVHDPIEMQRLAGELPIERAASRFIVSTDPDEHVEKIARYIELGFRHLVFHDPGADQAEFLRSYGTEILPRLRARRSEEHTSELQSLMRISYAVFCLKKKTKIEHEQLHSRHHHEK